MYREISVDSETGSLSISTADVKSYLKIDYSDDDTLIQNMITSARVYLENYLSRDLVAKSRKYYIHKINCRTRRHSNKCGSPSNKNYRC